MALPKLKSDEIGGTISRQLDIQLHWLDEDASPPAPGSCPRSQCPGGERIQPESTGPAMLSSEPFKSDTIAKEMVMKVLRHNWEFTDVKNNVTCEFTFEVPFKKCYISWEINKGNELDLTQSQLDGAFEGGGRNH